MEKRPGWDGLGVLQLRTVAARQYPIDAELGDIPKTPPARRWMGRRGNAAALHMAIAKKANQRSYKMMELSTVGVEPTPLRSCVCTLLTGPKTYDVD